MLSEHGYHRYEISNYARNGYECIHNKVYWQRGDYAGFGLGAVSMVGEVRWNNARNVDEYSTFVRKDVHTLTKEEQMEEFMFLGLRLIKGVKKSDFRKKFGVPIEDIYGNVIEKLYKDGLIIVDDSIRLTPYGIDISNYVMAQFLFF